MVGNCRILLSFLLFAFCNAEFPPDIPHCKAEEYPCIIKAANDLVRRLGPKGLPELGVPIFDPYYVTNISLNQDSSRPINVNIQFTTAEVRGLANQVFERVAGFTKDPQKSKFEFYGYIPKLEVRGEYKANGRVLLLPVTGEGKFEVVTTNIKGGVKVKTSVYEKDGQHYLKIDKLKVLLEPQNVDIKLTNLFNGNKQLSDSFLEVINNNWKDAWEEISPPIFEVTENLIRTVMQQLLDHFPHEDYYLPD